MRFHFELSDDAHKQLAKLPRDVQERIGRAIDDLEAKDDSQWSNVKALQGPEWKGRLRRKAGPHRIIFMKHPGRGVAGISAIVIRSKRTYK